MKVEQVDCHAVGLVFAGRGSGYHSSYHTADGVGRPDLTLYRPGFLDTR